jgi:hypothetical protein
MAVPRISLAWILVFVIVGVIGFFGYQIYITANQDQNGGVTQNGFNQVIPHNQEVRVSGQPTLPTRDEFVFQAAPIVERKPEPLPMPAVVGQTEEDLRATRPVSETPPTVQYAEPEAQDPMEGPSIQMESEFGDNLRHPEQMVEMAPPMGTMRVPASGLGGDERGPVAVGGNRPVNYSPELAQNGGEFMSGIFAFDGSDGGGIGYSMV